METKEFLDALRIAERLKDTIRHCCTSGGRPESVAEHSWMLCLMAFLLRDRFPDVDMDKVLRMCVIHDLGECFTGDIPTFAKTQAHEQREDSLLQNWLSSLPQAQQQEMTALYEEMSLRQSREAMLYKALDSLEALVQHNLSPLSSWSENEYELNLHYADDKVAFSPWLQQLRQAIREDSLAKIQEESKKEGDCHGIS